MRIEQSGKLRVNLCIIYFDAKIIKRVGKLNKKIYERGLDAI